MISIVIPVYNTSAYLDVCLKSIIALSIMDWECILIDDGSTDDSDEICDRWAQNDPRFKVYHQQNQGVSVARNRGIQEAEGDYIYFIDSDDWCEPDIFEYIDGSDVIMGEYDDRHHAISDSSNYALDRLQDNLVSCMGSFIVKRELLQRNALEFKTQCKYGEDLAFTIKCLLYANSLNVVRRQFMHYRKVPTSAVHRPTLKKFDVFYAWSDIIATFPHDSNPLVIDFLKNVSLPETMVKVTRELVEDNMPIKDISKYIQHSAAMLDVVKNAPYNPLTPDWYRRECFLLGTSSLLFLLYLRVMFMWYDVHASLGRIKNRMLCR